MTAIATIRVKPPSGERPDKELVESVAEMLRGRGFDVRRLGRFGVSVAADEATFQRELGLRVQPGKAMSAAPRVNDRRLAKLIDLVEIAPRPINF